MYFCRFSSYLRLSTGEKVLANLNGEYMQILHFCQQNHIFRRKKSCDICWWLLFWSEAKEPSSQHYEIVKRSHFSLVLVENMAGCK